MPYRIFRSMKWLALGSLAVGAGTSFAACSSSSAKVGTDGGAHDASLDADDAGEEAAEDAGGGGHADAPVYPDALSLQSPDGCFLLGAACTATTICCSGTCGDAGCARATVQQ